MKPVRILVLFLAVALSAASLARAQQAVLVVRHGEKFSEKDERLTEAGHARAARLAAMLRDAGVAAIYSTNTERTIGTVKPLADLRKLPVQIYDKDETPKLIATLRKEHANDIVLVAGHTNTIPGILKALGCAGEFEIAADEYDNVFVVVPKGEKAELIRLRY
jgi:broad specificity phosphatase PhoE